MGSKEEEQREAAVAGVNDARSVLTPAFSCRRWSRLTGKTISPSDARAWRKRSQQRARTALDHCDSSRERGLPTQTLPASPRPVENSATLVVKHLGSEQLNQLVNRIYGGRASPGERKQQQRKQQCDAMKDQIYLPAVTNRSLPLSSRDRQTADRPARPSRPVTALAEPPMSGGWISSPVFQPPRGIKLLSTELPELRARLMRHDAVSPSQDQCVLFFSPTPPPQASGVISPPSAGQTSPGSPKPHQSRRPVSQQHQRHHRKLKNRDGAPATRAHINRGAPSGDFVAVSSTGGLEANIVGALEARETGDPAIECGYSRRGAKDGDEGHKTAASDTGEYEAPTEVGVDSRTGTGPSYNEQEQGLDALAVDDRQVPPSPPEPADPSREEARSDTESETLAVNDRHVPPNEPELNFEEKTTEEGWPIVELIYSADDPGRITLGVLDTSEFDLTSPHRPHKVKGDGRAEEAKPVPAEDQLAVERDSEPHTLSDDSKGVDLRMDATIDGDDDSGKQGRLDATLIQHNRTDEVAEEPNDATSTEGWQHAATSPAVCSHVPVSTTILTKTASIGNNQDSTGDATGSDESGEVTEEMEAPEVPALTVQLAGTTSTLVVTGSDRENGEAENVEGADAGAKRGLKVENGPTNDGTDVDSTSEDPEAQRQPEVPNTEVSLADSSGPSLGDDEHAQDSDGDEYSEGDDEGDDDAIPADQDVSASGMKPPDQSTPFRIEQAPAGNGDENSSRLLLDTAQAQHHVTRPCEGLESENKTEQEVDVAAASSARRPSLSTYDADFEDEEGDDEEDPNLQYYDSDEDAGGTD